MLKAKLRAPRIWYILDFMPGRKIRNSFIGYIFNAMIQFTVYFSHMHIVVQIMDIIPGVFYVSIQDHMVQENIEKLVLFLYVLHFFGKNTKYNKPSVKFDFCKLSFPVDVVSNQRSLTHAG